MPHTAGELPLGSVSLSSSSTRGSALTEVAGSSALNSSAVVSPRARVTPQSDPSGDRVEPGSSMEMDTPGSGMSLPESGAGDAGVVSQLESANSWPVT
jgi:hypothetical protein